MRRAERYNLVMTPTLFHLDHEGSLSPLREAAYGSNEDLQVLIAAHPTLLGGDPDGGGGWFALKREGPLPADASRSPRWSVEHLFLARDERPTVVETLIAGDTRAHGDLFGQILFYAANAGVWWPGDALRVAFAGTHALSNGDAAAALAGFIGDERAPDDFWAQVEANLVAGKVRMVLVVDEAQPDLTRMVAFLNDQLRDAEVWILQVKQLEGASGRLLQTQVVGRRGEDPAVAGKSVAVTARAPQQAAAAAAAPTDARSRDTWVSSLRARCDAEEKTVLDDLLRWMSEQYGATSVSGSPSPAFRLSVKEGGKDRFPFGLTASKAAAIHLGSLSSSRAYEAEEARRTLIHEIVAAGLPVTEADIWGDLRIPLKDLASADLRSRVLSVLDGVIETLRLKEAPSAFLS